VTLCLSAQEFQWEQNMPADEFQWVNKDNMQQQQQQQQQMTASTTDKVHPT
jgi:hypothetical protein